jgi:hypothetical protein
VIGEDKLPGFIMVLTGVHTGFTVGVLFTGQPNRWAPRQTKSINDSHFSGTYPKVVFMFIL